MPNTAKLHARATKKRLTSMRRHVLVCVGDDCEGGKVVKRLRKLTAAAGIRADVTVTKSTCLHLCKGGPIMVVYPEGTWYAGVDERAVDRIVHEHLVEGRVVERYAFMTNALTGTQEECGRGREAAS